MLTHNNILDSERAYCARLNLTWQDVFMIPAPLGHATGCLHGVTAPFFNWRSQRVVRYFHSLMRVSLLEQQRCTCMLGATPFVYDLLNVLRETTATFQRCVSFFAAEPQSPKKWRVNASSAALNY